MKVNIGFVQKPFGIRGEVKIMPTTDFIDERFEVGKEVTLLHQDTAQIFKIESVRKHQNSLLVKFEGLDSLDDVAYFHRAEIQIDRDDMHDLETDEYYFVDLEGCHVYQEDKLIGTVSEVMDMPAHPVLRIKTSGEDILIPFVETFIQNVSLEEKKITINFMEGLY